MANDNSIVMSWINQSSVTLSFFLPQAPQHGTDPAATPAFMAPGGSENTSSVEAAPSDPVFGPGPEGSYQWQVGTSGQIIQVNYNHPFGSGTTTVMVSCPPGFLVAGCGQGPAQAIFLDGNCLSLQSQEATVQFEITQGS